jgi:hypothetical protein
VRELYEAVATVLLCVHAVSVARNVSCVCETSSNACIALQSSVRKVADCAADTSAYGVTILCAEHNYSFDVPPCGDSIAGESERQARAIGC